MLFFTGCATTGALSKTGYALVGVQTESEGLTYNKGDVSKKGEACSYNILGIVSYGDSGVNKAKKNGGLSKVKYYDTKYLTVLGFFGSVCTIVYGK